jgi:pimeloyl-ACP methyl ester carboxylesterase
MSWWGKVTARFGRRRAQLLHVATDTGSGPVVILVHGIASSWVTFARVIPRLAQNHRVIAVDILGFGQSPAPEDCEYTLEDHVASLDATIRSLKLTEPFTLVGHSLGSLIVSRFAAMRRTRASSRTQINHLVLASPPIYVSPTGVGDPRVRAGLNAYLRAYDFIRSNKEFTLANAAIISRLLPKGVFKLDAHNWTPFIKSLEHCIESQTTISDIANVHVPVDVVYGALDGFMAPGGMAVIERMRHVTMRRLEASDHLIRKRLAKALVRAIDGDPASADADAADPARPDAGAAASVAEAGPG